MLVKLDSTPDGEELFKRTLEMYKNLSENLSPGGPRVDGELIAQFVNGEVHGRMRRVVAENILTWRGWFDAHSEVLDTIPPMDSNRDR